MSFTDNFGNPKGLLGRMMLVSMDREHLPMAKWALADIGCSGGYNIKRMLEMTENTRFVGIDISDESVKKAKKINSAEIGRRVKIIQGSAEKLPFKNDSIKLVTAFETVFFWKEPDRGFSEIYRCLENGGSLAVINNYGAPNVDWEKKVPCMTRYTAEQISDMLKKVGFDDISVSKKDTLFLVIGRKNRFDGDKR